jgi:hypothetical protein
MKFRTQMCMTAVCLCAALAMPVWTAARQPQKVHLHFKFVDLGTLGGPQSSVFGDSRVLNNHGVVAFGGDTTPFVGTTELGKTSARSQVAGAASQAGPLIMVSSRELQRMVPSIQ